MNTITFSSRNIPPPGATLNDFFNPIIPGVCTIKLNILFKKIISVPQKAEIPQHQGSCTCPHWFGLGIM